VKTIGIGSPVVDLATGVGGVWGATGAFGDVVQIDPELGVLARRIPLGDPDDPFVPSVSAIGVGDGRVWAGTIEGLAQIDPAKGERIRTVELGGVLQVAVGDGAVWSTTLANRAIRTEASSARETASFYPGNWVYPIDLGGSAVWVGGGAGLSKLDPVTATALFSSRPTSGVSAIAFGEGSVWVSPEDGRSLVRLNPETGDEEARIEMQGTVVDLVVDDGLIWVAVQAPD
jgi:hypothetical protein